MPPPVNRIVTLTAVAVPSLPTAPNEYSSTYHDQYNNILRLYFNQIYNLQQQLIVKKPTFTSVSGDYTVVSTDDILLCDASAAQLTITIPSAVDSDGRALTIKKIDSSSNYVVLSSNSIDGSATQSLVNQYVSVTIRSDGTNWWIV